MSVQFGRWNFDGQPPASEYMNRVNATLAPYGPDGDEAYSKGGVKILYRAFHTVKESRRETQPCISPSGEVITWDGRLDNRAELISELRDSLTISSTDLEIVAVAYEEWGTKCFAKLIGDWALSIWSPVTRSLTLAKDPVGVRHLYYAIDKDHVTWSTILDPLVLFAGKTFTICEEYIAGWLSYYPAAHLTPYVGIYAVPPSSSALLQRGKHTVDKYWDFDPGTKVRYRTDAEYEEHFRIVFAKAVQRRLRSDRPILAELSGGMDSSCIVCMADTVIARGAAETQRLDTVSWYDESDPNWGERPYFTKVEEKRGRIGYHIDFGEERRIEESTRHADPQRSLLCELETDHLAATPFSKRRFSRPFKQYETYIKCQGYRVTLSGIGGEGPTGGAPTPRQELQNLLARARFITLARQLNAWALKMRKSRLLLLWEAVRGFLFREPEAMFQNKYPTCWFAPDFLRRNRAALCCYPCRMKLFGPLPSFQDHIHELNPTRRFLAYYELHPEWLREVRYPYLDRNLLEFAYAIPREQLVRVGQRRSLMKRALVGIVPNELLDRRKRTTVPGEPPKNASMEWLSVEGSGQCISSMGITNLDELLKALQKAQRKEKVPIESLKRVLFLDSWLGGLTTQEVVTNSTSTKGQHHFSPLEAKELKMSSPDKNSAS